MRKALSTIMFALSVAVAPAHADENAAALPPLPATQAALDELAPHSATQSPTSPSSSFVSRAVGNIEATLDRALDFIGIRYKHGGSSPETGFDCSGFVKYLYDETLGLVLPHSAKAISQSGEKVDKNALRPGDLVFFNTMRRAFSHVGIYLGDNKFIHAPRSGAHVRIDNLNARYWSRRYNGARRIQ